MPINTLAFSDDSQLLIVNQKSINKLDINCHTYFRPNILIDGDNPFDEDNWLEIMLNNNLNNILRTVIPAYRCRVVNNI